MGWAYAHITLLNVCFSTTSIVSSSFILTDFSYQFSYQPSGSSFLSSGYLSSTPIQTASYTPGTCRVPTECRSTSLRSLQILHSASIYASGIMFLISDYVTDFLIKPRIHTHPNTDYIQSVYRLHTDYIHTDYIQITYSIYTVYIQTTYWLHT